MTYIPLLDQISPFLESQFSALPIDLQNKLTQKGIEKPNIVISADVSKWDKLSKLQREYLAALYDFHYSPNHRRKAASEKLIESIISHLETKFSDLPQQMKMNIAYVDIFQKWDEISTEQRKQMAHDFDARMQPDYKNSENIGFVIESYNIKEHWDFFAQKKTLLADEAIPLMNGLDPNSWEEYKKNEKDLPKDMIRSIERCLKIALADGIVKCAPSEWLVWGRIHDLDKPTIRSHEWLHEPDVCMWGLFASAVNKHVEETASFFDSNTKQELRKSKPTISKSAGRPKSVRKNAAILKQIILILTDGININSARLPGNARDLHDVCKRIARAKSKKNMFSTSLSTFKEWLKAAGYGFGNGRTLSIEAKYWTDLCVEKIGKIDSVIFT